MARVSRFPECTPREADPNGVGLAAVRTSPAEAVVVPMADAGDFRIGLAAKKVCLEDPADN
jgi:hypothetical protein